MKKEGVVRLSHVYAKPPSAVWRALTDPELHAKWWAAGDVRPIVGHRFDLDMGPWGKQACEVLEVEHEKRFKYRFGVTSLDTTLTWTLEPEGDGTRLVLVHEGFDLDSPLGKRALEGMGEGWPKVLRRIEDAIAAL